MRFQSYQRCIFILLSLLVGLGSPVAQGAEQVTYYHLDALGSPIAATDQAGNVVWKEAYRPYGDRIRQEDNGTNTVWYTGKPYELGVGLSYFGARWYDPTIGRFMAIDPVEVNPNNLHSFNRYAYANNNPYKYVDPDGNIPILVAIPWLFKGLAVASAGFTGYEVGSAISDVSRGEKTVSQAAIEHGPSVASGLAGGVVGKVGSKFAGKILSKKGLTGPKKYFENKTKQEAKNALENKFGSPKSSRKHADTYYNPKSKRTFNVHQESGHQGGKPHVDIRRRGGLPERKYGLKGE